MEANNMTIGELCSAIVKEAERLGYAGSFIWNNLAKGFSCIRGYYRSHRLLYYPAEDTLKCLESCQTKQQSGKISRDYFRNVQLSVKRMNEFAVTGTLSIDANRVRSSIYLSEEFERFLDQFILLAGYGPNTVHDVEWIVKKYLKFFSDAGHASLETVTLENVRDFIMKTALQVKTSTLHDMFAYLRRFHGFLKENGIPSPDAEALFSYTIHREMPIQGYVTDVELEKTISIINPKTQTGCRDIAIILLAASTGMRACDIIRLKLTDIDWLKGEIKIKQDKTDVTVALPLMPDVGRMLQRYILKYRPSATNCEEVFLRCAAPRIAITDASSLGSMMKKYQKRAGVERNPFDGKGFHGLRRHLAHGLLTTGTPPTTIAQILGHTDVGSVRQYLVLDVKELKECAVCFTGIEMLRKELMQ